MSSLRFAAALLAGLVLPLRAQDTSPENLQRVAALFGDWNASDSPGMALGIVHAGELVWSQGFGMANLETGLPNGPDVIYRIGSTSKQFTATCIALLALDGELNLDADVRTFFPEFPARNAPVTVRHLIHHMSGLPDYIDVQMPASGSTKVWFTPAESIAVIGASELEFAPGARFSYSNSNYLLLGEIVRRVSGKSLRAFAEARIFEPLGMQDTHFHDHHDEVVVGRSHGYSRQPEPSLGAWRVDITTLDHVGDGGVFTTVQDLVRWDANFRESRLEHGQALLDLLHTRGVLADGTELDYAFGLALARHRGLSMVSHGGEWVGYRAELIRLPEPDLSVILLMNQSVANPTALALSVLDLVMAGDYPE